MGDHVGHGVGGTVCARVRFRVRGRVYDGWDSGLYHRSADGVRKAVKDVLLLWTQGWGTAIHQCSRHWRYAGQALASCHTGINIVPVRSLRGQR